jgi:hypothetical protein
MFTMVWHWIVNWIIGWGGIGALISAGLWVAWYFSPLAKPQLLHAAIIATAVTVSATYFFTNGYNTGYATAINHIASQNKEASDAVKKAISNVDQCATANGTWDTVTGSCSQ